MYTLTLTQNEFKALVNLLDLGVKAIGLGAVTPEALAIRGKLEAAQPEKPRAAVAEPADIPVT